MPSNERYAPVGSVVWNAYWQFVYRVVSHNADGTVTVERLESSADRGWGQHVRGTWSHRTPLDKRDRILYTPRRAA
jgi:hypothetical protein